MMTFHCRWVRVGQNGPMRYTGNANRFHSFHPLILSFLFAFLFAFVYLDDVPSNDTFLSIFFPPVFCCCPYIVRVPVCLFEPDWCSCLHFDTQYTHINWSRNMKQMALIDVFLYTKSSNENIIKLNNWLHTGKRVQFVISSVKCSAPLESASALPIIHQRHANNNQIVKLVGDGHDWKLEEAATRTVTKHHSYYLFI